MNNILLRTDDKGVALGILEKCLDSPELLNAGLQKCNGLYTVEVTKYRDEAAPEDAGDPVTRASS